MAIQEDTVRIVKANPFKTLIAIMTVVGMLVSGVWAAEYRYNQEDEIMVVQNTVKGANRDFLDYQIRITEDKVFMYNLKESNNTATSVDKAMSNRAKEYLKTLREKRADF